MKKFLALCSGCCLLVNISIAQNKKVQASFNINPLDAHVAAELRLTTNSIFHMALGFGYGSVNSTDLKEYYIKSDPEIRASDVALPKIFFAPYLNLQYRNYFLRASENRKGHYTGNNSGVYAGARLKLYTAPAIVINEQTRFIEENYMFGLMIGWQKAVGGQKRILLNANTGLSTHANYNLSFFGFKPLVYGSIGYILK